MGGEAQLISLMNVIFVWLCVYLYRIMSEVSTLDTLAQSVARFYPEILSLILSKTNACQHFKTKQSYYM